MSPSPYPIVLGYTTRILPLLLLPEDIGDSFHTFHSGGQNRIMFQPGREYLLDLWASSRKLTLTYSVGASLVATGVWSLLPLGYWALTDQSRQMNIRDAILLVFFANLLSSAVMVLNGRAAAKYHIGFPALARAAFGTFGSYFYIVIRSILGIIWGGVYVQAILYLVSAD